MRRQHFIVIFIGICCIAVDHFFKIDLTNGDPNVQYSFVGAIIGGVASLASGVIGSIAANKKRRNAERLLDDQKKDLQAWRDAELGTDYLDRADSRAAMRRVLEYNKEAQKGADTEAIKRGMTDEAKVAQAAKLNENYADVVSQIAGIGAQHKDRVQQQYMGEVRNLDNLKIQNMMDTSGVDSLVQGISGAASSLGSAIDGIGPKAKAGVGVSETVKGMAKNGTGTNVWATGKAR